jgi:hypothetical protein
VVVRARLVVGGDGRVGVRVLGGGVDLHGRRRRC